MLWTQFPSLDKPRNRKMKTVRAGNVDAGSGDVVGTRSRAMSVGIRRPTCQVMPNAPKVETGSLREVVVPRRATASGKIMVEEISMMDVKVRAAVMRESE
jgi:hypothetical protein